MKDIKQVDYHELDVMSDKLQAIVMFLDGTTETYTTEEDLALIHAQIVKQQQVC